EANHELVALALDVGTLDVLLERLLLVVHVAADGGARDGAGPRADRTADERTFLAAGERANSSADACARARPHQRSGSRFGRPAPEQRDCAEATAKLESRLHDVLLGLASHPHKPRSPRASMRYIINLHELPGVVPLHRGLRGRASARRSDLSLSQM